jgi:predicted XRE-type DNA-binding protein
MTKKTEEEIEISLGSGNVFEDLEFENPKEAKAKADLSREIHQIIKKRKINQTEAAKIMGIDQPKVSDIVRGKLSKYTLDRLIRFVRLLGSDVEIHVNKHTKPSESANLLVVCN